MNFGAIFPGGGYAIIDLSIKQGKNLISWNK